MSNSYPTSVFTQYLALAGAVFIPFQPGIQSTLEAGPPKSYIAPSFTWPSVNKRVSFDNKFNNRDLQPLCEVMRVDVQLASAGRPFGHALPGGELVVRGPLIRRCILQIKLEGKLFSRLKVRINEKFDSYPIEHPVGPPGTCYLDCRVSECASPQGASSLHRCPGLDCPLLSDKSKYHRFLDLKEPIGVEAKELAEVDVLLVLTKDPGFGWRVTNGLVLSRPDPNSHVYQRIRLFKYTSQRKGPKVALEASGLEPWMAEITIQ